MRPVISRGRPGLLALAIALPWPAPVLAGGGPHLVDDAGTVAPGNCEFETYGNIAPGDALRLVASPTCAIQALGNFEIGLIAAFQSPANSIIPGFSLKTGVARHGIGAMAAEVSVGFDPEGNRLGYVSTNVPVTLAVRSWLEIDVNAGLDFQHDDLFIPTYGVSVLVEPLRNFQLVAEMTGRQGLGSRQQFGIRAHAGPVVLDALYSRNIDEVNRGGWATFGLTWAFGIERQHDRNN